MAQFGGWALQCAAQELQAKLESVSDPAGGGPSPKPVFSTSFCFFLFFCLTSVCLGMLILKTGWGSKHVQVS